MTHSLQIILHRAFILVCPKEKITSLFLIDHYRSRASPWCISYLKSWKEFSMWKKNTKVLIWIFNFMWFSLGSDAQRIVWCPGPCTALSPTCAIWVLLWRLLSLLSLSFHCCPLPPALCLLPSCSAESGMSISVPPGLSQIVPPCHTLLCSVHPTDSVPNLPSVPCP